MNTNKNTKINTFNTSFPEHSSRISLQPASAQQRGGARFNFAPNYYRLEQATVPEVSYHPTPHSVRNGHVPNSQSI